MSELKKCPFCGGEAKIEINTEMGGTQYQVLCTKCPVTVGRYWFWKKEEAIKAWNTRKPLERIVERLEEESYEYTTAPTDLGFVTKGRKLYLKDAIKIIKEEGQI